MNSTQKVYELLAKAKQPMTALQIATATQLGSEVVRQVLANAAWSENVGKVEDTNKRRRAILWRWNGQPLPGTRPRCKTCQERDATTKGECGRCYSYRSRFGAERPKIKRERRDTVIALRGPAALRQKLGDLAERQQVSVSEAMRRLIEAA